MAKIKIIQKGLLENPMHRNEKHKKIGFSELMK
jgi:hypothetical protein